MSSDAIDQTDDARPADVDAEQISDLRSDMLRFAVLQLRDAHLAEDIVHEAIAAALKSNSFEGRAGLKTWVFSILRNKIVDVIRERSRHPQQSLIDEDGGELDDQFDAHDHWRKDRQPTDWLQPEQMLENEQFWVVFEACLNHLPENTARIFMMREHLGLEVSEICTELSISESNCWVVMHRARMRLRSCLENNFLK